MSYKLVFPDGFDDFVWELESKGWLAGAVAVIDGRRYRVTFYDPTRLAQDIESELKQAELFFEPNLLVVPAVTRAHMETAIAVVAKAGLHSRMSPEI